MKQGKDNELFEQALVDPAMELSAEILAGLAPEQLIRYNRNRLLDQRLRDGFSELSAQVDAGAPAQDNFLKELANRLDHAEQTSGSAESSFFLKIQLQSFFVRIRELMVYSSGAGYRWAPALLLLIAAGLAPILVDKNANGDAGDNLAMSGKAGDVAKYGHGQLREDSHKVEPGQGEPDGNLGVGPGEMVPGELPGEKSMDAAADRAELEMKLLETLKKAKDKASKRTALQALEKHYQSTSEKEKLSDIRKRLKSL